MNTRDDMAMRARERMAYDKALVEIQLLARTLGEPDLARLALDGIPFGDLIGLKMARDRLLAGDQPLGGGAWEPAARSDGGALSARLDKRIEKTKEAAMSKPEYVEVGQVWRRFGEDYVVQAVIGNGSVDLGRMLATSELMLETHEGFSCVGFELDGRRVMVGEVRVDPIMSPANPQASVTITRVLPGQRVGFSRGCGESLTSWASVASWRRIGRVLEAPSRCCDRTHVPPGGRFCKALCDLISPDAWDAWPSATETNIEVGQVWTGIYGHTVERRVTEILPRGVVRFDDGLVVTSERVLEGTRVEEIKAAHAEAMKMIERQPARADGRDYADAMKPMGVVVGSVRKGTLAYPGQGKTGATLAPFADVMLGDAADPFRKQVELILRDPERAWGVLVREVEGGHLAALCVTDARGHRGDDEIRARILGATFPILHTTALKRALTGMAEPRDHGALPKTGWTARIALAAIVVYEMHKAAGHDANYAVGAATRVCAASSRPWVDEALRAYVEQSRRR